MNRKIKMFFLSIIPMALLLVACSKDEVPLDNREPHGVVSELQGHSEEQVENSSNVVSEKAVSSEKQSVEGLEVPVEAKPKLEETVKGCYD